MGLISGINGVLNKVSSGKVCGMFIFLMVIQGIIAVSLIFVIMLQKSDGSGLSGLGGAGSPSGFMSARGTANLLTRLTGILAALFMGGCLLLAALVSRSHDSQSLVHDLEKTSALYQDNGQRDTKHGE